MDVARRLLFMLRLFTRRDLRRPGRDGTRPLSPSCFPAAGPLTTPFVSGTRDKMSYRFSFFFFLKYCGFIIRDESMEMI